MRKWVLFLSAFLGTFFPVRSCNEAVCGPVVSKCLLIQSCQCDLKNNQTCTTQCFNCLGGLYTECCNCLDMCPKTANDLAALNKISNVEDLLNPVPELFEVLVETPDPLNSWTSEKFQVQFKARKTGEIDGDGEIVHEMVSVNCSVAYWMDCLGYRKCKDVCISMGSSSFRFFHHGCCECVGSTCINYGINENMCPKTANDLAALNKISNVEDLLNPVPELFEVLVETPDPLNSWTSEKFQVQFKARKTGEIDGDGEIVHEMVSVNCSVAYWMDCLGYRKCKDVCISMGSSSFRFFHHGCCECVGSTCINYGINESRCHRCSIDDDESITMEEDELDYGEEDYEI